MGIFLKEGVMDAPEQHFKPSNPNPFDEARKEEAAKKPPAPPLEPEKLDEPKPADKLDKMKESIDEDLGIGEKKFKKSSKKSVLGRADNKRNARASKTKK